MHANEDAHLSRTHLCLSFDHFLTWSWHVCLPMETAKIGRCWMAQRCLSSLGLSQILGKRQSEKHFYSYFYTGSVPWAMRRFNVTSGDNPLMNTKRGVSGSEVGRKKPKFRICLDQVWQKIIKKNNPNHQTPPKKTERKELRIIVNVKASWIWLKYLIF